MFGFASSSRVARLEEDLKRLERNFQALELEWGNVYDKLRKAMGRIVKSRAIIEAKETEEGADQPAQLPARGGPHGPFLTPRQREVQQAILRRRAGG